jgi:hypothetical protein
MDKTEDIEFWSLASASTNESIDRSLLSRAWEKGGHVGIYKLEITDINMGHRVYRSNVMVQHIPDVQTTT